MKYRILCTVLAAAVLLTAVWLVCRDENAPGASSPAERVHYSSAGGNVKTLDPAFADDLASRDLTALCYDTLVQYDYLARPYRLQPSMLAEMPEISADRRSYRCRLRNDLFFAPDRRIPEYQRQVSAEDVKFSILRIADARNHSPVYWMYRNRISGIGEFRRKTAALPKGDMSIYDEEIPGIKIISDREFILTLDAPDPGFLFLLAMPNAGVVSRRAALAAGENALARKPAGSGAFVLEKWIPNLKLRFRRNKDFREEYFLQAANPADRRRRLPLLDAVEIYQVRQMMTQWMLFLQGDLDRNALDKDNSETLAAGGEILPALADRGVKLEKHQEFEIRYVGFNFRDPVLGKNLKLRQALREAYDISRRISHASGMLVPAAGPVPDGVAGHLPLAEASEPDYQKISRLLTEAGYPGGIDPATGEPLEFTFDQAGSTVNHRQMGELAADDWRKIGVLVTSKLNSRPLFSGKLRRGKFQLFRYSWVGDYPDAANFLQLFYSKNIGSCNYCGYADEKFDRMYEKAVMMPDCPERTQLYLQMARYLDEQCVWIYEGFPVSGVLSYDWLENSIPHDFNFTRWKYLSVDVQKREQRKKSFRPLSLNELASGENQNE